MKTHTQYLYSFANASLTLNVIQHLHNYYRLNLNSVTVINTIDRWLININLKNSIDIESAKNLQAVLNEMGVSCQPPVRIELALKQLAAGDSPTAVMNRYRVVIVAYGQPELEEVDIFRKQIIARLGYCPQNMV
ncbi:hypothetical protein [Myxosarcina sp. GI1]|uniref:hypothetical protein n=1 Tax=Myxosarcina sp. GI1 TaxID=1541065 RepID=UPI00055E8EEF|nr:hypothetical protein [Myxosarcina sp. GI1]